MNQLTEPIVHANLVHELTTEQAWYYRIFPAEVLSKGFAFYCENEVEDSGLADELERLMLY